MIGMMEEGLLEEGKLVKFAPATENTWGGMGCLENKGWGDAPESCWKLSSAHLYVPIFTLPTV